jgi:DNA-binding YbaB/EbfC family protein
MPPNANLQQMLAQAQKMQQDMEAAQAALKEERVDASAGGGMVRVVATGDGRLESIAIDKDAVDPDDVELLQDMVLAAVNEALRAAEELRDRKMGDTTGGFDPMSALDALGGLGGGGGAPGAGAPGLNRAARRAANKKR